jgi:hypothetical protein
MSDENPFGWEEDEQGKEPEGEDELDDIPRANETPEQAETRKERRRERGRIFKALEEVKADKKRLEDEVRELRQGVMGVAEHQQRQGQPDPLLVQSAAIDKELQRLSQEAQALGALWREKGQDVPQEVRNDWERRYRYAEEQKQRTVVQRTLRESGFQPAHQTQAQTMMAEHTDVQSHSQAYAFADGAYRQLLAEGHQPGQDTLRIAMNKSRERFGLHKRPGSAPTAADRSRFSGTRSSSVAGDDGGAPAMTPELKKLAHARYSTRRDLTPQQKEKLWMREHGSEFKAEEAKRTGRR